ncbi:MAG: cupin domain-containing protein [Patescibacteria group bacterium]|jgi:mannose-6-phosphate isomerase-like protein (cupin superfamily)
MLTKLNVLDLPVVPNVCGQVLREVERNEKWSIAHVAMNPQAMSQMHYHEKMDEVYVILQGQGEVTKSNAEADRIRHLATTRSVTVGNVIDVPGGVIHVLSNTGYGMLEHLIIALPPFDPEDVQLLGNLAPYAQKDHPIALRKPQDCFDGAKIIPYIFRDYDLSIAYGWTSLDAAKDKRPHYHKRSTEWIYVVGPHGQMHTDCSIEIISSGDWIKISPETPHAFNSCSSEDLILVSISSPAFDMEDVYFI